MRDLDPVCIRLFLATLEEGSIARAAARERPHEIRAERPQIEIDEEESMGHRTGIDLPTLLDDPMRNGVATAGIAMTFEVPAALLPALSARASRTRGRSRRLDEIRPPASPPTRAPAPSPRAGEGP